MKIIMPIEEVQTPEQIEKFHSLLPRCDSLDGSTLKIEPHYTEAGYFAEANCIVISDEEGRKALYAPCAIVDTSKDAPPYGGNSGLWGCGAIAHAHGDDHKGVSE